ncbi:MAG: hypothetical protein ACRDTN_18380, partial [Mycobacterium sp.]
MSGPNPPGPESGAEGPGSDESAPEGRRDGAGGTGDVVEAGQTSETEAYAQAYSAPESEQFTTGPYVPVDPRLYDYDSYDVVDETDAEARPPRWPWVVGVATIIAAIALVV